MRRHLIPILFAAAVAAAVLSHPAPVAAQLRPLPPAEWLGGGHRAACGVGRFADLGAGRIGARGTLVTLGDCVGVLDLGGARIQVSGDARRAFTERSRFAAPAADVDPDLGPVRRAWGDLVLETLVPIPIRGGPWTAGVRFGARWPNGDNTVGLSRDRTDVHVAVMGGYAGGGAVAGYAELGVGINGTRHETLEQQDVLLYAGFVEYRRPGARFRLGAVGHAHWLNGWTHRGNENQGEVRAGVRVGDRWFADAEAVVGLAEISPAWGVRVRVGVAVGRASYEVQAVR